MDTVAEGVVDTAGVVAVDTVAEGAGADSEAAEVGADSVAGSAEGADSEAVEAGADSEAARSCELRR